MAKRKSSDSRTRSRRSLVRRQTRDSTTLTAVALTPCAALQPDRPMRLAGPMFRTRELRTREPANRVLLRSQVNAEE